MIESIAAGALILAKVTAPIGTALGGATLIDIGWRNGTKCERSREGVFVRWEGSKKPPFSLIKIAKASMKGVPEKNKGKIIQLDVTY